MSNLKNADCGEEVSVANLGDSKGKAQITLGELQKNQVCRVLGYNQKGAYRRQLLSLGVTPGAEVKMVRSAPLGDPLEFQLLGFNLCLRRKEAYAVNVELLDG